MEEKKFIPPTKKVSFKEEKKDKDDFDMRRLHRLVTNFVNDIIDLKKILREESTSSQRNFRPFYKRNTPPSRPGGHIYLANDNEIKEGE